MEVFSSLKLPPLIVRPMPMRKYRDVKTVNAECCRSVSNIDEVQQVLGSMDKEVCENNQAKRTRAQKIHNVKTIVLPLKIDTNDYVMVRVDAKRKHKLQHKWKGQIKVIKEKRDLVFVLEDIYVARTPTAHTQRLVPYPVTTRAMQKLAKVKQHAT